MATTSGNYDVAFRGAGLLGPATKSWPTPYTQDDYAADMKAMPRSNRGNGSPAAIASAFSAGGFGANSPGQQATMKRAGYGDGSMYGYGAQPGGPAAGAGGSGQQPGQQQPGNAIQFNTGMPIYNPINPGWQGVGNPGMQQAGLQAGDLVRQMNAEGALGQQQQASIQNNKQNLAHQIANAQAGIQMGGVGLGAYGNQLAAAAPWERFASNIGSMPIRAIGGLMGSMLG